MFGPPMLLSPARTTRTQYVQRQWLPVLYGLVFISFTSTTFMGGSHTQVLVNGFWHATFGQWHASDTGIVNQVLRKTGHFFGYGMISLLFRNAWYHSAKVFAWVMRSSLTPFAASLAVASTFFVACLDEWHQTFLVGRVGSLRDALLDTAGALLLNVVFWAVYVHRRRKAIAGY